ncbi:MAG: LysE family translocator [Lautropia sp.]
MTSMTLLMFCAVAFVAIVTPGPTVLLALGNGTRHGLRLSLYGMAGAVVSDLILVAAAALGLGALLAASEVAFGIVKWIGALYLAWIGIQLLRSNGVFSEVPAGAAGGSGPLGRKLFMRSFLTAVTNPKGYLFVSALMPQFVDPAAAQWSQWVTIGALFCLIDFFVMLGYAAAGARAVRLLRARGTLWLDRASGAALLAMAGSLALFRRTPG